MGASFAYRAVATWLCNCISLVVAAAIVPAISYGDDLGTLLLAGAILAVVNLALRLVILMTLPAVIISFGVALVFINALMLWLTSRIVSGLYVGGFWSTVAGALLVSLVNLALRPWRRGGDRGGRRWVQVTRFGHERQR